MPTKYTPASVMINSQLFAQILQLSELFYEILHKSKIDIGCSISQDLGKKMAKSGQFDTTKATADEKCHIIFSAW